MRKSFCFHLIQVWKSIYVHVIFDNSAKTVLKGTKQSSCIQQSCQSAIMYLVRFMGGCHSKAYCQEKDDRVTSFQKLCIIILVEVAATKPQSCRVVVGTAFLAGNITWSSAKFRKILIEQSVICSGAGTGLLLPCRFVLWIAGLVSSSFQGGWRPTFCD